MTPAKDIAEEFHSLLSALVALHERRLSSIDLNTFYRCMTRAEIALSMLTVKADIGRLTGKTEWIINNADDDSLVIVAADSMKDYFASRLVRGKVVTPWEALLESNCYRRVYIDEPSWVFNAASESSIYNALANEELRTIFIQVGW